MAREDAELFLKNNSQTAEKICRSRAGRIALKLCPDVTESYKRFVSAGDTGEKAAACAAFLNAYEHCLPARLKRKKACLRQDLHLARSHRGERKVIDKSGGGRDYYSVAVIAHQAMYIREWALFYEATGADRIYVYDNSSEGFLLDALKDLVDKGLVVYIYWPGRVTQMPAYRDAVRRTRNRSTWLALVDSDEFLFSPKGPMPEQLKAYEDHPGVVVNWVLYGPNGHDERPQGLVMDNYTTRIADDEDLIQHHIKSIVQPKEVSTVVRSHFAVYRRGRFAVDSRKNVIDNYRAFVPDSGEAFTEHVYLDVFRINHYQTKSLQDVREKCAQGYPNGMPNAVLEEQLRSFNVPLKEDYCIKPYADIVRAKY